jgi:hypothetical protein
LLKGEKFPARCPEGMIAAPGNGSCIPARLSKIADGLRLLRMYAILRMEAQA